MSRSGSRTAPVPWTTKELQILHSLRARGLKFSEIAPSLPGRTAEQCARRHSYTYSGAGYNAKQRQRRAALGARQGRPRGTVAGGSEPRIDDHARARQTARLMAYDRRDLTASIFGDPPKGFSELDLRNGIAP